MSKFNQIQKQDVENISDELMAKENRELFKLALTEAVSTQIDKNLEQTNDIQLQ